MRVKTYEIAIFKGIFIHLKLIFFLNRVCVRPYASQGIWETGPMVKGQLRDIFGLGRQTEIRTSRRIRLDKYEACFYNSANAAEGVDL